MTRRSAPDPVPHPLLAAAVLAVSACAVLGACAPRRGEVATVRAISPTTVSVPAPPKSRAPVARLAAGRPVQALGFTARPPSSSPFTDVSTSVPANAAGSSPTDAVRSFLTAAIAGDEQTAWALVSSSDRDRLGSPQRISEAVRALGWRSFTRVRVEGDSVTAEVQQTPTISDIDGVIAPTATLRVRTIAEQDGFRLNWTRRGVEQHFPAQTAETDARVAASATAWVTARQACDVAPPSQVDGGLAGVVGLATQLCQTSGAPVITSVGDLDTLDEPQPVIDSFGPSALQWARVVKIAAPVPLSAVLAPRGNDWIVVALARPSIADS